MLKPFIPLLAFLPLISAAPSNAATEQCFDWANFHTDRGFIRVNGLPLVLKGISWFGAETDVLVPHGLWSYSMDSFLDIIANNQFNAIRVPFSLQMVKENKPNNNVNAQANPDLVGKTGMDVLEILADKAAARGVLLMLDNHRLRENDQISELWYDGEYTEAEVLSIWKTVLDRLGRKWNVFAIDLKNEPHGAASWGWQQQSTDWNSAAERFIQQLAPKFNNLFFVEGVEQNAAAEHPSPYSFYWGENLQGVVWHPVKPGDKNSQVVYSPHVYGPDVYNQNYFQTSDFPNNMPGIWDQQFGSARDQTGQPVVIGEWGGRYRAGTPDETWANKLADYLIDKGLTDQFYWCLNPDSGDTGGLLLDDWRTPDQRKIQLLHRVTPNPTRFQAKNGKICITPGTYPNPKYNF